MEGKDLTGSGVGKLLLIKRKRENNRTFYYCKCDCENEKWIRADKIKGETANCGCERKYKFKDLTNKKFGMLTALEVVGSTKNNGYLWKCKCDCGKIKNIPLSTLISGTTISCGCYQKQKAKDNITKAVKVFEEKNLINGTNIAYLNRDKVIKSNTSGVTGVTFNNKTGLWIAYITFKRKRYYLGSFKDNKDAIRARKEAEEKLHKKFLMKHKQEA
ncbi:MAG: AP2 domain-containing protein [Clostridium celatum]|nr:AP2 domain-containing protein [Clostridium celatum]